MLLLDSYNPKKRKRTFLLSNTSAWRLLVSYATAEKEGELVLVPGARALLDVQPEDLTKIDVSSYGKVWGGMQTKPLELYEEVYIAILKQGVRFDKITITWNYYFMNSGVY